LKWGAYSLLKQEIFYQGKKCVRLYSEKRKLHHPHNLLYIKSHEWVLIDKDNVATVGITDFAQDYIGELCFVDFAAKPGDEIKRDEVIGTIESYKAVSDVYSPLSGTIMEVNDSLVYCTIIDLFLNV